MSLMQRSYKAQIKPPRSAIQMATDTLPMPEVPSTLTRLTACDLVNLIQTRAVSPVDVVRDHISAIGRLNPILNAVCTLNAEEALAQAKGAEIAVMDGKPVGLLHGLPIGIKDITQTAGIRTTFGCALYKDHVPTEDAEVVTRLKKAGGIVLCKTNTPEFAAGATTNNRLFGMTRNPWDIFVSPAGSSGGSAAAVASGMLPLAHGTDYGGSIRVPASFCGIVGIRPTPGLIPNHPMHLAWDPGQVHGPLARTVEDVALMLDAMVGLSSLSPISMMPPWKNCSSEVVEARHATGTRLAYVSDLAGMGVDPEVDTLCRAAALKLADAGAQVHEIAFDASDGRDAYLALRSEWMLGQQFERLHQIDELESNLAGNIRAGLQVTARDTAAAENKRTELWHRFRKLFGQYDFLLAPTAAVQPFAVELRYPEAVGNRKLATYIDWIAPTFLVTLVGLPAASVPAGKTTRGLPVGIQIVAPRFAEPGILALAKLIQQMNPIGRPPNS
jgi:amidase